MSNYQLANLILGETVHLSISVLMFFASVSACIHFIDGVFKQTQPKTPPESFVGVETSPTIVEPVPAPLEPVPAPLEPVPDFTLANLYTIRELKAMASKRKVKNYGRLTKIQLVEALTSKD
jgi:hypothetical protein